MTDNVEEPNNPTGDPTQATPPNRTKLPPPGPAETTPVPTPVPPQPYSWGPGGSPAEAPPPGTAPYPAPQPGATAYGAPINGLAMKRRNPFAAWIGLPIITLGIYQFVWYYKIHKEMDEFDPRRKVPVIGPLLVLLLLGWTIIAPIISFHNAGKRIRAAQHAAGLEVTCNPLWCWLLWLVFGLNVLYMQIELDKVVDRYPGAPAHTPVPLYA
jgi:Domain of unknown function (DUF4234)